MKRQSGWRSQFALADQDFLRSVAETHDMTQREWLGIPFHEVRIHKAQNTGG